MEAKDFEFEMGHIGINEPDSEEAKKTVETLCGLFGFTIREIDLSYFLSEQFEIMKMPWRGKLGHFSIRTNDIAGAKKYLESKGIVFDEDSAGYNEDGSLRMIYARDDIAGFAWHLNQK